MIATLPLLVWPRFRPLLTTLIYHRVLPAPDLFRTGEVDAGTFERQMRFISRHFQVLPLREAADLLSEGRLPQRACCITFDDGYADNLTVAAPILQRLGLPATIFVATSYLDGGRMFNDAVIDAIANAQVSSLDLSEIGLGVHEVATQVDRQSAITTILKQFRRRTPELREAQLPLLIAQTGTDMCEVETMLQGSQVRELAVQGFEIGGHTATHPILTSVDDARAREEIEDNKRELESLTGSPVRVFAYPNGLPARDYSTRHVDMVRTAGFATAVTTARGVANRDSDLLQIPRLALWGATEREWAMQLMRNAWIGRAVSTC